MIKAKILKKSKSGRGFTCLIQCGVCKKKKWVKFSNIQEGRHQFCSFTCMGLAKKGKPNPFTSGPRLCVRGEKNCKWKGGRMITRNGYVYIHSPNHPFRQHQNYVLEHRLKMEKKLGRYLTKKEIVHHKNGIKNDNRIENLELITSQAEHARQHHCQRRINKKSGRFL